MNNNLNKVINEVLYPTYVKYQNLHGRKALSLDQLLEEQNLITFENEIPFLLKKPINTNSARY